MKKLLAAMFVALLMAGCGGDTKKPAGDRPESNASLVETPPAKTAEVGGIDLDDNETRNRIIAEAIDEGRLQKRGKDGEKLVYAPNQQNPLTGWVKFVYGDGQIKWLRQYKDGKKDGVMTSWYENGKKAAEGNFKDGDLMSAVVWKPNGEKCPHTNIVDGNGVVVGYKDNGNEQYRFFYQDGKRVP